MTWSSQLNRSSPFWGTKLRPGALCVPKLVTENASTSETTRYLRATRDVLREQATRQSES